MKKVLYILPFIILIFSCDEDKISNNQAKSFIKYYGGSLMDEGVRVLNLEDGNFLVLGNIETSDNGKQICVFFTDKFGNSTSQIYLYGFKYNDYASAIKKNNEGYVIVGSTEENTKGGQRNVLIIQIGDNGEQKWIKSIADPSANADEVANDFLVLSDQSLVITGYKDSETTNPVILFLKTDPEGNIITFNAKYNEVINCISPTDKSDMFLFAGYTTKKELDITSNQVFIAKWGGVGPFEGGFVLDPTKTDNAAAIGILPQEDGSYIIPCMVKSGDNSYLKVKCITASGKEIIQSWEKYYNENEQYIINYGVSLNNKLYFIGTSGNSVSNSEDGFYGSIVFLEMNNNGQSAVFHYMGDGSSLKGNGFDFTDDKGLIITGANKLNANSMITLIKLNSNYSLQ